MIDAKTLTYVTFSVVISILVGAFFGWRFNNTTKIAEFYVVKSKTLVQTPVSGFQCECYGTGAGGLQWLGATKGSCANNTKSNVAAIEISKTLKITADACCQGIGTKNSPVIKNNLIFKNVGEDPCL